MNRRKFLMSSAAAFLPVSGGLTLGMLPTKADAFAITLASVSQMAAIGQGVIGFLSGGSTNVAAGLALENYKLLVDVHSRLDDIEKTLIRILREIDELPEVLRAELSNNVERVLTTQALGIIRAQSEAMDEFDSARNGDNADGAYARLLDTTGNRLTRLSELRGQLSYYSDFAALALIGMAATELSMSILLGANPTDKSTLRNFYNEKRQLIFNENRVGSLARLLLDARRRHSTTKLRLERMLAAFPTSNNTKEIETGTYLARCHTFGLPSVLYDQLSAGGGGHYKADYDRVFQRHETNRFRNGVARERETANVSPIVTVSHQVEIYVDTFEANGVSLMQVRMSGRPNSDLTGGTNDRRGNDCTDLVSRPHVTDGKYLGHVQATAALASTFNLHAESLGVLEEYANSVKIGFEQLDVFFERNGVPT